MNNLNNINNMTWIVVADSSKARIYSAHKASLFTDNGNKLSFVSEHTHPDSRKKDSELVSDKQGRYGRATFSEATDPKQHQEEVFAMELTKNLASAHNENHYHELIFIAPAAFMGLLNKHLSKPLTKLVNLTIEKDYTGCNERELLMHLRDYL